MKTKILLLAMLISMCSGGSDVAEDKNIVSLSTTHTEIIQMLEGENLLVGVDSFSETELPIEKIDAYTVTAEELLILDPDIVLVAFDFNGIVEGLENLDIEYALLPPAQTLDDVYSQIETVGSIINKLDQANSLVSEMKSDIDDIIANSIGTPLSVYHEIGYTYGIYSVNENSFIGEIYNLLGVDNIANTIEDPYGSGYPVLEEEQVLAGDPDLIVIGHSDYLNKDLSTRQGWENIKAVANDNIYFLDENLANNWGVNTVDLINVLSETTKSNDDPGLIYKEKYTDNDLSSGSNTQNIIIATIIVIILTAYILISRRSKSKVQS